MRKIFIVFEIEDGVLTPHDHPVFTGEIAYDLGQEQQIFIHPEFNVREFSSEQEIYTAIGDYMREHTEGKSDRIAIGSFVILLVCSVDLPQARRSKGRSVKGTQPEKKSTPKKD